MLSYIKTHIAYVALGFSAVVLIVIGFLIYQKSNGLSQQSNTQSSVVSPTPQTAEIAFSIKDSNAEFSCSQITANPIEAASPASISFEAVITAQQGDNLNLSFDFGDGENQTVSRLVTNPDGQETQNISHTYTTAGLYLVRLAVTKTSQDNPSTCQTQVSISGSTSLLPTSKPSGNPTPTIVVQTTTSLSPTKTQINATPTTKLSPTRNPTVAKSGSTIYPTTVEDTTIPVPKVPEAGGLLPTVVAALAGITILLLAFAL